jgi:hypothetical protein
VPEGEPARHAGRSCRRRPDRTGRVRNAAMRGRTPRPGGALSWLSDTVTPQTSRLGGQRQPRM